ncbi:N-6 DNA methylase [Undibacterium sp. RTI2.1]|uniref:N-6 DNA methylase n=1 Tax=unclassified Undibacterium TaxID=2630295 RepID=UPI002AB4E791|nr:MULTISPECIES: N-6 DNA methylase [unclassified Undibacterium]MDY7540124.1 N-6 DNA methylase [Undibacterium sp. 5I1]MEB0030297.1 N-6 DNA methylase [Undibacterium sp. RTI2.1]MEB0115423.1 N-6 DNA methylase [Undibacterium sp. RTI2.2]MEB0230630.1 N-6 DNA methylase [Undibacterium sp. 10I3]MEB0257050.1 N-6 DNA methylase [Undibacterium sp. 5I1]
MLDAHYTPSEIARQMIMGLPTQFSPNSVADFACGDGALLSEAFKRWPKSQFIANDIDVNLTRRLRRTYGEWSVSAVDFLSESSQQRSKLFSFQKKVDCILINPPFSEKGRAKIESEFFGSQVTAGSTMSFLLRALQFLAPRGYMVAILPDSCFISQRDRGAWNLIKTHFAVQKILTNSRSTFKGIAASTTVAILHYHHIGRVAPPEITPAACLELEIIRGKLQMHLVNELTSVNSYPLVHTSNLSKNRVHILGGRTVDYKHLVNGPAVLVPRVGLVTQEKIAFLPEGETVVLSDCVLAIMCKTNANAKLMSQAILVDWNVFRTAYGGTGAPYTTLERIREALSHCANVQHLMRSQPKTTQKNVNPKHGTTLVLG